MLAVITEVTAAFTATRARVIELTGAVGGEGLPAGVPVTTANDQEFVAPLYWVSCTFATTKSIRFRVGSEAAIALFTVASFWTIYVPCLVPSVPAINAMPAATFTDMLGVPF